MSEKTNQKQPTKSINIHYENKDINQLFTITDYRIIKCFGRYVPQLYEESETIIGWRKRNLSAWKTLADQNSVPIACLTSEEALRVIKLWMFKRTSIEEVYKVCLSKEGDLFTMKTV